MAIIGRWAPEDIAYIERLELVCDGESFDSSLMMTAWLQRRDRSSRGGWPDPSAPLYRVVLKLEGLQDATVRFGSGGLQQISGFEISDVSDRGLGKFKRSATRISSENVETLHADRVSAGIFAACGGDSDSEGRSKLAITQVEVVRMSEGETHRTFTQFKYDMSGAWRHFETLEDSRSFASGVLDYVDGRIAQVSSMRFGRDLDADVSLRG